MLQIAYFNRQWYSELVACTWNVFLADLDWGQFVDLPIAKQSTDFSLDFTTCTVKHLSGQVMVYSYSCHKEASSRARGRAPYPSRIAKQLQKWYKMDQNLQLYTKNISLMRVTMRNRSERSMVGHLVTNADKQWASHSKRIKQQTSSLNPNREYSAMY